MVGKLLIQSRLKVLTGMHIGGSDVFSAIGAIDSPVVSDPRTMRSIIPGSSLKGKLRTLLARSFSGNTAKLPQHNKDNIRILRLFGSSESPIRKSRLQFSDAFVANEASFGDIPLTEVKFENTINRIDSVANPRQIERVISGVEFDVRIIYDIHAEITPEEIREDMALLAKAMKLLQLDYLGGHGTRGSGRVSFDKIELLSVSYDIDESGKDHHDGHKDDLDLNSLQNLFEEVEHYELLSI